ncbi:MAG: helicase [Armatimonadetes bacterium Cent15-Ar3]|nr:MAG: helicase [Armatimonadetes bacterium Cent15-Ar3]
MTNLSQGLYYALLTEALQEELRRLDPSFISRGTLHHADVADRIAMHVARVVERAISGISDSERVAGGVELARTLIASAIQQTNDEDLRTENPIPPGEFLSAIHGTLPDGRPNVLKEPLIPLLDTALLTNSPGEPRIGNQIQTEIQSANRIDVIMAFIRRTGIRPFLDELSRHCTAGKPLRILTTTYTGSTEPEALDELLQAGAQICVSYDETSTRLHAKGWLFHRNSGCSTAYIGSSNLTHSAQVTGLEWNVRFSELRNKPVIEKFNSVFESYWNSGDFLTYDKSQFRRVMEIREKPGDEYVIAPIEVRLEPFQERLLERIELSRLSGHHRNLLVSATGTGKTVMAAVDYDRLRQKLSRSRLLFIVHRKEILKQALATFRHVVRDGAFGELWVDGNRPQRFDHVFASIQSLNATSLQHLSPDHFDVVIVDEFHHAEAPSYRKVLDHLEPKELLGLTATPERADGLPLLHWFGNRIAAELRLWDAIDQQKLSPFTYFGVADDVDYTSVPWKRGMGYDVDGLTKLLTANDIWAKRIITELRRRVANTSSIRALGFCVSVEHARFMSRVFNEHGIKSIAIWSQTPRDEREQALRDLASKNVNIVFSIDLFNEGVDVPTVDTLLMLRPTDSATLFLQQLGRGLRKHKDKSVCTVLDFVGLHRKEYRFDLRFGTLLKGARKQIEEQVDQSFPFLPAGCHMELDHVAKQRVLANIRAAIPSNFKLRVDELRAIARHGGDVTLKRYLEQSGLTLEDIYSSNRSWSEYREAAGLPVHATGPNEDELRKACGRMLHIDDDYRISTYLQFLSQGVPNPHDLKDTASKRLLRMLVASMTSTVVSTTAELDECCRVLGRHPQVVAELAEVLELLRHKIEHVPIPLTSWPNIPLRVHAQYSRIEIQTAFGDGDKARPPTWREGVRFMRGENCDAFVFTRVKNEKAFSPTTLYADFAINRELVHWESQSVTRATSDTGLRYQNHEKRGSGVFLFARHSAEDRAFHFLGPATYVSHKGEKPMQVTWRLHHPMPGDVYQALAAAVA